MRTTPCLVLTLLCGWLAAPTAGASPTNEPDGPVETSWAAEKLQRVLDELQRLEPELDEAPPVDAFMEDEALLLATDPDEAEARLQEAEAVDCPAVPGGKVWLEQTQECGSSCFESMTAHVGPWRLEDTWIHATCTLDRVVLTSDAWELTLARDDSGRLDVSEDTLRELDALAARPELDALARLRVNRLVAGLRMVDREPPEAFRTRPAAEPPSEGSSR